MDYPYNIYGSIDSFDMNVMVFMKKIPENYEKICLDIETELSICFDVLQYPKKNIKVNIGVLEYGRLKYVLYGFPEEMNNCLFNTYKHHYHGKTRQAYILKIKDHIKFSIRDKIIYTVDKIIDNLSYTKYIDDIKNLTDLISKIKYIKTLNIIRDLPDLIFSDHRTYKDHIALDYKKDKYKELLSSIALLFGQTILLDGGLELYTKTEIIESLPELKPFLDRTDTDLSDLYQLNNIKDEFIDICRKHIKHN